MSTPPFIANILFLFLPKVKHFILNRGQGLNLNRKIPGFWYKAVFDYAVYELG